MNADEFPFSPDYTLNTGILLKNHVIENVTIFELIQREEKRYLG